MNNFLIVLSSTMFLPLLILAILPPSLIDGVSWIIDIKIVLVLDASILCHHHSLFLKGQPVTQPAKRVHKEVRACMLVFSQIRVYTILQLYMH